MPGLPEPNRPPDPLGSTASLGSTAPLHPGAPGPTSRSDLIGGYRLAGIAPVRAGGRKALRIQCAWRALVVWAPWTAALCLLAAMKTLHPEAVFLSGAISWIALAIPIAYVAIALRFPSRGPQDFLAGTRLVPR